MAAAGDQGKPGGPLRAEPSLLPNCGVRRVRRLWVTPVLWPLLQLLSVSLEPLTPPPPGPSSLAQALDLQVLELPGLSLRPGLPFLFPCSPTVGPQSPKFPKCPGQALLLISDLSESQQTWVDRHQPGGKANREPEIPIWMAP